jgi:hypothetical protein
MPDKFRLRPLHRQRQPRRKVVRVLNQDELAERLGVELPQLCGRLNELGWPFHQDSAGRIWATELPGK